MTTKELSLYCEMQNKRIKDNNYMDDLRTARVCQLLANINRDSKKRSKPYTEKDFMPTYEKPKRKKMKVEHMEAFLKAITRATGGVVDV